MILKHTTLCAVIDRPGRKILMIKRHRGLNSISAAADGMGKDIFNLPGGKRDPGESFLECAVRESAEETGITPIAPVLCGQLQFEFADAIIINQVFKTEEWSGELAPPNDECTALWMDMNSIPYDKMWADDKTWFPEMLAGKFFHYKVVVSDITSTIVSSLPLEEVR